MNTLSSISPSGACSNCGSPMAGDQRYCLSCGSRRDGAPVPFREVLATPAQGQLAQPSAMMPTIYQFGNPQQGASPTLLTTFAALGCVLLAFGIGILIGDRGKPAPVAATPQIITAPTAGTSTAAEETTTDDESASKDSEKSSSKDDSGGVSANTKSTTKSEKKAESNLNKEASSAAAKAKADALVKKNAEAKTPKEAQEASKNQPDVILPSE